MLLLYSKCFNPNRHGHMGGGELSSHLILGSEFQLIDNDNKDTLKVLSGVV